MEWQGYVGLVSYGENGTEQLPQAMNRPGEIDNSKLVSAERINGSEEPELQRTLREGEHYTLVPQEVWQRLYEWYLTLFVFAHFDCSSPGNCTPKWKTSTQILLVTCSLIN